ncbi:MAG: hypothetical protein LLG93_07335 [Deltaproteobacteria bacterium]|nr:hypothetical protein [Deltaproteobacteria bacterium]
MEDALARTEQGWIDNRADGVPFAGILADLLMENLTQHPEKRALFERMKGGAAIELTDIEAAVTLIFAQGRLRVEAGVVGNPLIVIRTTSGQVTDLNAIRIVGGLPWYGDEAGRKVLGHLCAGRLKIKGMFAHPLFLTRLTILMSVV